MLKRLGGICFALVMVLSAYAGGSKDTDETAVTDPASWQDSVDVNDKQPGKYNFYIQAKDLGGNVKIAGPYNMYIDPNSDLPVIGITNPRQDMRVPGNLNIVGTCVDDDGVDSVELVFDGQKDSPARAEGKDFWSFYLDTRQLSEGSHTIAVTGIDINGLRGKTQTVLWNLDRKKPQSSVTNHALGDLVAGRLTLAGTVSDGNGIDTLQYSLDKGQTFDPVELKKNNKTNDCTFSLSLDTTKMKDGPAVCWFRARDLQGTFGIYTFLFFVDNSKPDVRILYPAPGVAVNGKFTVAGYAGDLVEVAGLTWKLGKETGTFDLTLGNPWWSREFDITGQSLKEIELEISALDTSGNITVSKRKFPVDQEADRPVVVLTTPTAQARFDGSDILIAGLATDDDGIAVVQYQIDGGVPVPIECDGAFRALATGVADGAHTVSVWATDINGVDGPKVTMAGVVCSGLAPQIKLNSVVLPAPANVKTPIEKPFASGLEIHPESGAALVGTIVSGSALESLAWRFEGLEETSTTFKKGSTIIGGTMPIKIPVPADVPYGAVPFIVTATDIYGRVSKIHELIYVTDLSATRGDNEVVFDDARIAEDGTVRLDEAYPLTGFFAGGKVTKARLEPATKYATLTQTGNLLTIRSTGVPGAQNGVTVVVDTDHGFAYKSRAFNLVVPTKTLEIELANPELRSSAETVTIAGTVQSDLPVSKFAWKCLVPGGTREGAFSGEYVPDAKTGAFSITLDPAQLPDGPCAIELEAVNGDLVRYASVPLYRPLPPFDAVAAKGKVPAAAISWLESGALYYFVTYPGTIASHSVTVDGVEQAALGYPEVGVIPLAGLAPGAHAATLKIIDDQKRSANASGKATVIAPRAHIQIESVNGQSWQSGMPVELPLAGTKDAQIVAKVESALPVSGATWSVGAQTGLRGTVKSLGGSSWEISLPLGTGLAADRTPVSVTAEIKDGSSVKASGVMVVTRPVDPAKVLTREAFIWANPVAREDGTLLLDANRPLRGFYVGRPLGAAKFEKDSGGLTCEIVDGAVQVSATREGTFAPGKLLLTDVDGWSFRAEPSVFLFDESAPSLTLASPSDGDWIRDSVELKASFADANKIGRVEYSIDLGATWVKLEPTGASVAAKIDFSGVSDGLIALQLRVTDEAGKTTVAMAGLHKDTQAPVGTVVVPASGEKVNGEILLGIALSDAGKITRVEYQNPVEAKVAEPKAADVKVAASKKGDAKKAEPAAAPAPAAKESPWVELDAKAFISNMVGTERLPLTARMRFRFTDASGNVSILDAWDFTIDSATDLPVAEIHLPEEGEVVTSDFVVSGVVFDDDRPAKIWYKIDGNPEVEVLSSNGYSVPVALKMLTDNEHSVTVYAEDVYGVKGLPVTRNFRVSLEEPKAEVVKPGFDKTNRGIVEISGTASDKNGIALVQVSVDNGNSFNDAVGTESWSYSFDTRIIQDGTHVVFVKVFDKYGIEGLYSSLINIDNTAPQISLEMPLDGMRSVGPVFVSGQTTDGITLKNVTISVRSLTGSKVSADLSTVSIKPDDILAKALDFSSLDDGLYNVDVSGTDAAGNLTRVSRNVILDKKVARNRVECLYPLNGQHLQGNFNLYGQVFATDKAESVTLYIDGVAAATQKITPTGYFGFPLTAEALSSGNHVLSVRSEFAGHGTIASQDLSISYRGDGQWVTIDNLVMGDFAFERPWLSGRAGYIRSEADKAVLADKKARADARAEVEAKRLKSAQISFDNGRTFRDVSLSGDVWRYRVETQDMPVGYHFLIVRALMADGSSAVTRTIIQIDKTAPVIRLISPGEGGLYNQSIEFAGLASDDIGLSGVSYSLRKGDKASYELPGFIQGLYFDVHGLGVSLFDVGVGLTFFDDNVKLQVQYGQLTDEQWAFFNPVAAAAGDTKRLGGDIFGAKLLANIMFLPVSYFLGPDWNWLSANFAVGANFSLFSETQSGRPQVLSAVLGQVEFPRVTRAKAKMFRTFAFYNEIQVWFIPTDSISTEIKVDTVLPRWSCGIRLNMF